MAGASHLARVTREDWMGAIEPERPVNSRQNIFDSFRRLEVPLVSKGLFRRLFGPVFVEHATCCATISCRPSCELRWPQEEAGV